MRNLGHTRVVGALAAIAITAIAAPGARASTAETAEWLSYVTASCTTSNLTTVGFSNVKVGEWNCTVVMTASGAQCTEGFGLNGIDVYVMTPGCSATVTAHLTGSITVTTYVVTVGRKHLPKQHLHCVARDPDAPFSFASVIGGSASYGLPVDVVMDTHAASVAYVDEDQGPVPPLTFDGTSGGSNIHGSQVSSPNVLAVYGNFSIPCRANYSNDTTGRWSGRFILA